MEHFDLDELNQFTGSETLYRYWSHGKLVYTEGVQYLASKMECYWLIDEIGRVIFSKLLRDYLGWFYVIHFLVYADCTAIIKVDDGNGNTHLEHKINWTDFPMLEKPVKFFLCESDGYYCLMLPSEY
jgi:hypothetical protein